MKKWRHYAIYWHELPTESVAKSVTSVAKFVAKSVTSVAKFVTKSVTSVAKFVTKLISKIGNGRISDMNHGNKHTANLIFSVATLATTFQNLAEM